MIQFNERLQDVSLPVQQTYSRFKAHKDESELHRTAGSKMFLKMLKIRRDKI